MKLVFCDAALCMSFVFIKLAKSHWERHRIYKKFVVHHKDILFSFSSIHIMSSAQYHRLFKYFALFSLYLSIFYFWMFLLLLVTLKLLSKLKFFLKKNEIKYTHIEWDWANEFRVSAQCDSLEIYLSFVEKLFDKRHNKQNQQQQ